MSAVQDVTKAASAGAIAAPAAATSREIQDRFLKLLVTQLKNQDPLNPMDNAQITSQLSQISTVSGIEKLNTTLQGLSTSLMSSQSMQSTALIGHTVFTDGNALALTGGAAAPGGIQLAAAADSVKVNIIGPSGAVVRQLDLGPQPAGVGGFKWDGLNDAGASVASGNYTFQVTASSGGRQVGAAPLTAGTVSSVTLGADGLHITVGGAGSITMDQIKRIM
jgi:flagellar basal-body rod modification protein FlgD